MADKGFSPAVAQFVALKLNGLEYKKMEEVEADLKEEGLDAEEIESTLSNMEEDGLILRTGNKKGVVWNNYAIQAYVQEQMMALQEARLKEAMESGELQAVGPDGEPLDLPAADETEVETDEE